MSAYHYKALNDRGKTISGLLEADSERQVRDRLRKRQLRPLAVRVAANDAGGAGSLSWWRRGVRLSTRELALLTRQLASLIKSGLPVDEALLLAAKQGRRETCKGLLMEVRSRVLEGQSLAQAMANHPRAFDGMFLAMVRAGESTGYLGEVLERLASYTESSQHSRQKLRMAMIYPMALLGVSVLVVGLLMTFVVPRLVGIFAQSGQQLPLLTRALIQLSEFASSWWAGLSVLGLVMAMVGLRQLLQQQARRLKWHRMLLKVPGLGAVLVESDCARFSATLAILLNSGVPLLEALRIAAQVMDNLVLRAASEQVMRQVREGGSLGKAMEATGMFPPMLVQMALSGEANGSLAEQLAHGAQHQERELEMLLGTTMALLEPFTILFMGGLVTLIMLAILLPIFDINQLV